MRIKEQMHRKIKVKDGRNVFSYFQAQRLLLIGITITGIIYNVGLLVTPWFEGQFAQYLANGMQSFEWLKDMCLIYLAAIAAVQGCRFLKRLFVRVFANRTSFAMKQRIYANLLKMQKADLGKEDAGNLMTKAISDAEDCAEGMRKFLTEIFDTGVALFAYLFLLCRYDWKLTLLCMVFPPFSYLFASKMKKVVSKSTSAYKKSSSELNDITLDRVSHAVTYRIYGMEENRHERYLGALKVNQNRAVTANFLLNAMPPVYELISQLSVVFIVYFGYRNVLANTWNIAMFTTYLSCYLKLAKKSGKAAKLFNHVQKARVSWNRIVSLLNNTEQENESGNIEGMHLSFHGVGFCYGEHEILKDVTFKIDGPALIGMTGSVASGKSTLGKLLLHEGPYTGSIQIYGKELSLMSEKEISGYVTYLGHDPELLNASVHDNIAMGEEMDTVKYLKETRLYDEVMQMKDGIHTFIGEGGTRLSGGQAQRLALARTLAHAKQILILDDPFSPLDENTEAQLFEVLQKYAENHIIILISHRLKHFPKCNQVYWIAEGRLFEGSHDVMMQKQESYRKMYEVQK